VCWSQGVRAPVDRAAAETRLKKVGQKGQSDICKERVTAQKIRLTAEVFTEEGQSDSCKGRVAAQ
jgi:hypothetical protein